MIEINLLPWREIKREREKKEFTTLLLASLVFAIVTVFLVNYYATGLVDGQTQRNQRLRDEITQLDKQIAEIKLLKQIRAGLISRMMIIQKLQATRTLTVHLFDELIKILPDGVFLTEVKRNGDKIVVQGYTESNSNVSILMRNIEKNPWIQVPALTEIKKNKQAEDGVDNEFNLSFILKPKNSFGQP
ncbi:PilN domain-containing protein [Legionella dresdenensis]|uniref:PilN domain-containing protein n=1 Tax=Legionella dresdenensis TaxID=450200 RepID=A0ABV8CDP6_9GAMM